MTEQEKYIQQSLEQLGKRLRKVRKEKGYTNYEFFAYDNKISRSQYSRYENGGDLHMTSLLKILFAHGMSLKEFFEEGFEDKNDEQE